jgi:hypothetical protein
MDMIIPRFLLLLLFVTVEMIVLVTTLTFFVGTTIVYRVGIHGINPRLSLSDAYLPHMLAPIAGADESIQIQSIGIPKLSIHIAYTTIDDF